MDENNMTSDAIGIDLGTTYSCIGVWKNGRPEIIVNNQGNRITPSYVAFNNIEMMTGEAAKNQVFANSENTIYCAKRLIGRSIDDKEVQNDMKHLPYKILDKDDKLVIRVELEKKIKYLTPEEVSSYMLTCLKKSAELFIGKPVKDAVIIVPAYFNNAQRKSTMDAGKLAGLNVISIINEPTAAAIAYGLENQRSDKRTVLVFDLGGGTFDTTLLNITSKKFEVLATKGSSSLGGNDFDTRLVDHFVQLFKEKTGYDIKNESRPLSRLRLHVERAKCILSSVTRTSIQIDSIFRGIDFQESLTRAKFDDLCEDLFNSTTFYLDGLFSESNVSSDEVHDIILIGGSTRICKIQSIVSDYFGGKPLKRSLNPDEAVACGATILATMLTKPVSEVMKDIILVDVTPISLGVETKGFKMKITVPRNTPLPFKKTSLFTTASDYQTSVAVYVYEGESANSRSNYLLGQFELSDIPPALKGVPGIDVTFSIDRNGFLHVKAYNVESGTANSIRINYNRTRLGKTEIDTMVEIQQHRR